MLTSSPGGVPVLEPKTLVRRRFVMTLGVAAVIGLISLLLVGAGASDRIVGSGSTAAQPLIQRIAVVFQDARSGDSDWVAGSSGIDYEPVGSLGGIMRLADPEVDFAVADYPLSSEGLQRLGAIQFPIVIGSVSVVYNLGPGAPRLRFSPSTLAGIFSGTIASWSHPAIAADNPGVSLPASAITVVHRSDGSGTTLNWSTYLARNDADWQQRIGAGTTLRWLVGVGVNGSSEMAAAVASRAGAIGYLETGQARRAGLSVGAVRNAAGEFVDASEANVMAGSQGIGVGQARGVAPPNAYPVIAASYAVMKRRNTAPVDNQRTLTFLAFLLDQGAAEARKLGYLPLAAGDVAEVRRMWSTDLGFTTADSGPAGN